MVEDSIELIYGMIMMGSLNVIMSAVLLFCQKKLSIPVGRAFFKFFIYSSLIFGLAYLFFYFYNAWFALTFGYPSRLGCIMHASYAFFGTYMVLVFFELVKFSDRIINDRIINDLIMSVKQVASDPTISETAPNLKEKLVQNQ